MGASLQRQRFRTSGILEQARHRRMRNHAVQRAAAVEGIETDRRAAAETHLAAAAHIGSIRRQYQIELDGAAQEFGEGIASWRLPDISEFEPEFDSLPIVRDTVDEVMVGEWR